MSRSSPPPPGEDERPLDARETQEFERIIADYRRTARRRDRSGRAAPPALRWRTVALVLLASSLLAVLSTLLPAPANLWSPAFLLVSVALASLVRAVRADRRSSRH